MWRSASCSVLRMEHRDHNMREQEACSLAGFKIILIKRRTMAENEFEKNVRQEMDEFKVHPSGEVWSKIEERIREKNRKRRILFFILFPAIALMLGGYGIYRFSYTHTTTQAQNTIPGGDRPDDKHKTDNSKTEEHNKETIAIKPTIATQTAKQTKNVLHAKSKRQIVR